MQWWQPRRGLVRLFYIRFPRLTPQHHYRCYPTVHVVYFLLPPEWPLLHHRRPRPTPLLPLRAPLACLAWRTAWWSKAYAMLWSSWWSIVNRCVIVIFPIHIFCFLCFFVIFLSFIIFFPFSYSIGCGFIHNHGFLSSGSMKSCPFTPFPITTIFYQMPFF